MFAPIIDTAVTGLGLVALAVLALLAIRVMFAVRLKNRRPHQREIVTRTSTAPEAHQLSVQEPLILAEPSPTPERSWDLDLLKAMDWKRFEELCQRLWVLKGFPAELTGAGADGGIDIRIADRQAPGRTFAVAQCKAWVDQLVGAEKVRELWGAAAHFEAKLTIFYGLSGFTQDARRFAEGKHLKLIDGTELLQQIATLPPADQQSLLAFVTCGDYTTPSCPQCESKLAINPKRPDYWSCPRYPTCRYRGLRLRKAGQDPTGLRSTS